MSIISVSLAIIVPFLASLLTFFSGFGLGTILLPAFVILFPLELAIAMTAIVHFLNNIFKLFLIGKNANKQVLVKFGIPAIIASFVGASLLTLLSHRQSLLSYQIASKTYHVHVLAVVVGILMIFFALMELIPQFQRWRIDKKYLPLGGALSGFFGGLSGHQGAFRSAFLINLKLSKEAFIATGVVVACGVDLARLLVYGVEFQEVTQRQHFLILTLAVVSSFTGAWIGRKTLHLTTYKSIQWIVGILLINLGILIASGII